MKSKRSFFAEQLRKIMFEKNLTQQILAEKINVNRPLISRWIIGDRNPSFNSIKKLSSVLNVPLDYFVENKENKESNTLDEKDVKILQLEKENLKLQKENSELKLKLENEILRNKLKNK